MAIPELYRYGREGEFFGLGMFSWYMLDAIYQVRQMVVEKWNFVLKLSI
jgi:hypothetical protein